MEVVDTPGKGRSVVASRDIRKGELVLEENACISWEQGPDELLDLVREYVAATAEQKEKIDSLSSSVVATSMELTELISARQQILRQAEHAKLHLDGNLPWTGYATLLLQAHFNAHAADDGVACLFPLGAMFNHSCAPNLFYRFRNHTILFLANADIRQGEELTASYLDSMTMLKPTKERQRSLLLSKAFVCRCPRCRVTDADTMRAIQCTAEGCNGLIAPQNEQLDQVATLPRRTCCLCGLVRNEADDHETDMTENRLYKLWESCDAALSVGSVMSLQCLVGHVEEASKKLHPSHFITQFLRVLAIEVGGQTDTQRLQVVWYAFTYAEWLLNSFQDIPSNLIGTMTGALAELFDRRSGQILSGLSIDRVLRIVRTVLPYARIRHGTDAVYPRALEKVISRYEQCASLFCSNTGKLARCGRCDSVSYCSRSCQLFHYKSGGHKAECLLIGERRRAIELLA